VGLPELTGIDLYAVAQHRWPGIERRFIFVPGGFNYEPIQHFVDLVPNATIAKPYQITEIIEAVARLINNA